MSLLRDRSHGDDVTLYVTYRPSVYLICVCVCVCRDTFIEHTPWCSPAASHTVFVSCDDNLNRKQL